MSSHGKRVQLVLLCEDRNHSSFLVGILKRFGWSSHQVRVPSFPHGKGSGAQHVIDSFPKEVREIRKRSVKTALIAIIDEDTLGTDHRLRQLENSCKEAEVEFMKDGEPVCIAVPKRNVQTWFYFLQGNPVDEKNGMDYSLPKYKTDPKGAARELEKRCKSGDLGEDPPPSLQAACEEYRTRIKPVASSG